MFIFKASEQKIDKQFCGEENDKRANWATAEDAAGQAGRSAMNELLTPAAMAAVDARAIAAGVPGMTLMEAAGAGVAEAARRLAPDARRVLVLAGPGNNGGDGFVAARRLAEQGREVVVALLGDRAALKGDAAAAAKRWSGALIPLAAADPAGADLVIDALFGAGLSRPLSGAAAQAVAAANDSGRPILAVDVPSGLDGASGRPTGELCVRATETVTFVRLKPGHLLLPGRALCGPVRLVDIGAPDGAVAGAEVAAWRNRPEIWRRAFPTPALEGHKYSRGHVAVWSGPPLATGASRLVALAALRAGAGAVTLLGSSRALETHAAHVTAVMLRECESGDWAGFLAERKVACAVIGPGAGAGDATRRALEQALHGGRRMVLDADVFTFFAGRPDALAAAIEDGGGEAVLTPHEGEFRRLMGDAAQDGSKLDRARVAAIQLQATVVLKGPDTVVAGPDARAAIADNAPPTLATAGAGDVLAGICAGLMAQGMPAFEAACAAVWLHGEAANAVGPGLIADDLPGALPGVLKAMG
jgi:hydroxyethylthiazole kinase-like uncharacterized protein yjeF